MVFIVTGGYSATSQQNNQSEEDQEVENFNLRPSPAILAKRITTLSKGKIKPIVLRLTMIDGDFRNAVIDLTDRIDLDEFPLDTPTLCSFVIIDKGEFQHMEPVIIKKIRKDNATFKTKEELSITFLLPQPWNFITRPNFKLVLPHGRYRMDGDGNANPFFSSPQAAGGFGCVKLTVSSLMALDGHLNDGFIINGVPGKSFSDLKDGDKYTTEELVKLSQSEQYIAMMGIKQDSLMVTNTQRKAMTLRDYRARYTRNVVTGQIDEDTQETRDLNTHLIEARIASRNLTQPVRSYKEHRMHKEYFNQPDNRKDIRFSPSRIGISSEQSLEQDLTEEHKDDNSKTSLSEKYKIVKLSDDKRARLKKQNSWTDQETRDKLSSSLYDAITAACLKYKVRFRDIKDLFKAAVYAANVKGGISSLTDDALRDALQEGLEKEYVKLYKHEYLRKHIAKQQMRICSNNDLKVIKQISAYFQLNNKKQSIYTGRDEKSLSSNVKDELNKDAPDHKLAGGLRFKDIPTDIVDEVIEKVENVGLNLELHYQK